MKIVKINKEQFREIKKVNENLERIFYLLLVQDFDDSNEKIRILKKEGLSSYKIGEILRLKNVRQMEGWKNDKS